MCGVLEELAMRDAPQALALALGESGHELQRRLLRAVLHGWAGADLEAAGTWALSQPHLDYTQGFAAVFRGASNKPEEALRYVREISQRYPEHARDFASGFVYALSAAGEHDIAAAFAADGAQDLHANCLMSAYRAWGHNQPELAMIAAMKLPESSMRIRAFGAAISGWASAAPAEAANDALFFPAGPERTTAIVQALHSWVEKDPGAAAEWIRRHGIEAGLSERQWKQLVDD